MGTDIHGWIEMKYSFSDEYVAVMKADYILRRTYDIFGCLFGVMNFAAFVPIAPERGIPANVSLAVTRDLLEWGDDALYPTWITWKEIEVIDWNEESSQPDQRVHQYERNSKGEWVLWRKSVLPIDTVNLEIENSWEQNGILYKVEKVRRRDAMGSDWELVFKVMGFLTSENPGCDVRLIIWFDK